MRKVAVVIYGPPGSGKGTQANLLANKLDIVHFDTGRFLEGQVHDPKRQKEKIIQKERALFDSGKLMTPSFVLREVQKEVHRLGQAGWGVVFSGSPRTEYEAEGLIPALEKVYGKENIFVFVLDVPPESSVARNTRRRLCTFCGSTLLSAYYPSQSAKHCPVCGGKLYRRTVDSAKVIKVRLVEYKNRTAPAYEIWKSRGHKLYEIDGTPAPFKVFTKIYDIIHKKIK